ncbi:hypothetical protein FZEAL_3464 [Fusarium zealandicum]|uniref:Uncharacterized protein n=1 Tax=Fusarium zealandicum TaxID=1053134 RepID=A0A8H4UPI4_9HYPO|nr:hypothetical protein FZEAL_3464 [Fusarium zealandicum]
MSRPNRPDPVPDGFDPYRGYNKHEILWHQKFLRAWSDWGERDVPHEKQEWIRLARLLRFYPPNSRYSRIYNHCVGSAKNIAVDKMTWGRLTAAKIIWGMEEIKDSEFIKKAQIKFPQSNVFKMRWNKDGPVIENPKRKQKRTTGQRSNKRQPSSQRHISPVSISDSDADWSSVSSIAFVSRASTPFPLIESQTEADGEQAPDGPLKDQYLAASRPSGVERDLPPVPAVSSPSPELNHEHCMIDAQDQAQRALEQAAYFEAIQHPHDEQHQRDRDRCIADADRQMLQHQIANLTEQVIELQMRQQADVVDECPAQVIYKLETLHDRIATTEDEIHILKPRVKSFDAALEENHQSLKDEIRSHRQRIATLDDSSQCLKHSIASQKEDQQSIMEDKHSLKHRITTLEENNRSLQHDITALKENDRSRKDEDQLLKQRLERLHQEVRDLRRESQHGSSQADSKRVAERQLGGILEIVVGLVLTGGYLTREQLALEFSRLGLPLPPGFHSI